MQCWLSCLLGAEVLGMLWGRVIHSHWQVGPPLWQSRHLLLFPLLWNSNLHPGLDWFLLLLLLLLPSPPRCASVPALKPIALASDGGPTRLSNLRAMSYLVIRMFGCFGWNQLYDLLFVSVCEQTLKQSGCSGFIVLIRCFDVMLGEGTCACRLWNVAERLQDLFFVPILCSSSVYLLVPPRFASFVFKKAVFVWWVKWCIFESKQHTHQSFMYIVSTTSIVDCLHFVVNTCYVIVFLVLMNLWHLLHY